MGNTLSDMWYRYKSLFTFKLEMNKKGWVGKNLYSLQVQLDLLKSFIEIESVNVLNDLLIKKTYYRLLKSIDKGIEYLPDIIENPDMWVLNPIDKDREAWASDNVLIFSTKTNCAVFSKIVRNNKGYHYTDNKYQ